MGKGPRTRRQQVAAESASAPLLRVGPFFHGGASALEIGDLLVSATRQVPAEQALPHYAARAGMTTNSSSPRASLDPGSTTRSRAVAAWAGLNDRQRLYLATILEFDQAAEADVRAASARWQRTPPAAEWRQVTYDIKAPAALTGYSWVQKVLRERGQHDPGSGSTLKALRHRGLITVTYDHVQTVLGLLPRIRVRLTTLGRAAARHGAGITAPATTPKGLMSFWSVVALVRLYAAGEQGMPDETAYSVPYRDRAPSWNTLLRLRDRRDGSLIDERRHGVMALSSRGRRHWDIHAACYLELYPDLDDELSEQFGITAPEPATVLDVAHSGLANHTAARPRHLLRDTDLLALARVLLAERDHRCWWREFSIDDYERVWHQPVPAAVLAVPDGVVPASLARRPARPEPILERLRGHPGGALVDEHPLPPTLHFSRGGTLVIATPAGREHYATHAEQYRQLYPELDLP
jgi:hypothetical protein